MSRLEFLPDELLLLIFGYLHKFDLLYTFTNLNQRFQQIIEPHLDTLDLTCSNISYQRFLLFYEKIFPYYTQHIRSLKLSGYHQLLLFRSHIRQFNNLHSLHIVSAGNKHQQYASEQNQFLIETLSLPALSEITVAFAEQNILNIISSSASQNLKRVTLIYSYADPNVNNILLMPSIKQLSVSLKSTQILLKLLTLMPNLEKLKLSTTQFSNLENSFEIPKALEKLHLEFGSYSKWMYRAPITLELIKSFINLFKNQLRSLTLIAINVQDKDFANYYKFRSIVKDFICIEKFEYNISTYHQPDSLFPKVEQLSDASYSVFTIPKPQQFDTKSLRVTYSPQLHRDSTIQDLFNGQILRVISPSLAPTTFELKKDYLVNLHTIHCEDPIDDFPLEIRQYIAKIIALSSTHINRIIIDCSGEGTKKICERLKEIAPDGKQQMLHIKYLQMSTGMAPETRNYDKPTLVANLSAIFPNLEGLTLWIEQKSLSDSYVTFAEFIDDVRRKFRKLIYLTLGMWLRDQAAFEDYYTNNLMELTAKNLLYHTIVDRDGNNGFYYLNIWL